ncbi:phosphotyrosine protein phosphatase [Devosia sp. ZB163]|uniref:low molecular weight protein tyrosine phosphatase family protein n=1 Tax=Devosia sp. ZB163 TaxID=3025938 RepID=UPI00235F7461|nr:phosphotyrosine protein phosphatase [Devosia sp. ZB163]MDC9825870.1 phosphotyrosine protein phosphatase [Devosia sp. ZB163]
MRRILFICSRNRLRSPTAEQVFAGYPGIEVASAGLAPDAEERLTPEHLEGVDTVFVMERAHRAKLMRDFGRHIRSIRVICLDIPDRYAYMQPELVDILRARVTPHLR